MRSRATPNSMTGGLSLGFDLGGTQVRAALFDGTSIVRRAALATDAAGGPEAIMGQIQHLAAQASEGIDMARIAAIGMAAPGPLDTVSGIAHHIPTLPGWEGFPLRQRLSVQFDRPAIVENDGIAAAFGEWKHGAGRGCSNLIFVTVSTGIGGGVVTDGRLLHGRRGMAAHVGHVRLDPKGPICSCGGPGCFEALASGSALGQRGHRAAAETPSGYLAGISAREPVSARHVVEGARELDSQCMELLKEEARLLGIGFASLIHLFSPERIIMGGGVSQAFDLLENEIHAAIRREAMAPFRDVTVVKAELGDNAGLTGAAALALSAASELESKQTIKPGA